MFIWSKICMNYKLYNSSVRDRKIIFNEYIMRYFEKVSLEVLYEKIKLKIKIQNELIHMLKLISHYSIVS